jgi:hypothetical protein
MGDLIMVTIAQQNEDEWQRKATAAAVTAARRIVTNCQGLNPATSISKLADYQWGWIVAAIIFEWLTIRCEQAATEGLTAEQAVRRSSFSPNPCDRGAIAAILPQLGALPIDWSRPLQDWPRETMLDFLTAAFALIQPALAARDSGGGGILRKSTSRTDDFDDPIGF